jgi:hypothetical protein
MSPIIPERWEVPERFRQRVGSHAGRQRAMLEAGHLLLILHDIPSEETRERGARLFWRAPSGAWRAAGAKGDGLSALKRHIESFRDAVHVLDERVDNATLAVDIYQVLRAAGPAARAARNQHRALQQAREGIDDKDIISLRDAAGDVERDAEFLVNDAKNALEYLETKAQEEQTVLARKATDAQHRLNLIAALFFPVTALGSIFGTNLRTGLEGRGPVLFWILFFSAFGLGFLVRGSVTRSPSQK